MCIAAIRRLPKLLIRKQSGSERAHNVGSEYGNQFYDTALRILDYFYPIRTISVTSRDPDFVTARIKAMLRRKNRLMRAGRVEEAGASLSVSAEQSQREIRPVCAKWTYDGAPKICGRRCGR